MGARHLIWGVLPATLAAAIVLAVPALASATILYDQTSGVQGGSVPSAHHSTPADADSDAADDFIVPPGVIWNLGSVDVQGQALSPQTATVVLFADTGGLPGTELFRQSGIPFPGGLGEGLALGGVPPLPPGHYWLSVYTTWSLSAWSWRRQSPSYAFAAVWENPRNGDGTGCTTFSPMTQCGFASANGTDLAFRLDGEATPVVRRRKCKHRRHHRAASAKRRHCKKRRR